MTFIKPLFVLSTALAMLGCSSMSSTPMISDSTFTESTTKQLSGDVPLPPGASIKQQDTLVMSTGNTWIGRIGLTVSGDPQTVFNYFRDSLPEAGWTLTSSSFSKLSLLSFTKGERIATVQIQSASFAGNEALITVAPVFRPPSTRPPLKP